MKRSNQKNHHWPLVAALAASALLSPLANADARVDRYTTYGKVIRAQPIYREIITRVPVQKCWIEEERYTVREGYSSRGNRAYRHSRNDRYSHNNRNSRRSGNAGDTVAGTVIGGVIGNQLARNGSSSARAGATIAGAIIGSVIANEYRGNGTYYRNTHRRYRQHDNYHANRAPARETVYGVRPVEHCKTVLKRSVEKRIEGYDVTYLHRGRRMTTRTRKNPGSRIALNTRVSPVRGQ